jgi:hypothetical protein
MVILLVKMKKMNKVEKGKMEKKLIKKKKGQILNHQFKKKVTSNIKLKNQILHKIISYLFFGFVIIC